MTIEVSDPQDVLDELCKEFGQHFGDEVYFRAKYMYGKLEIDLEKDTDASIPAILTLCGVYVEALEDLTKIPLDIAISRI